MHYFCESLILGQSLAMFSWLSNALSYVGPVLLLALGLGLVIFVHELGHFVAAKAVGIKVETFSLGFGPRLFGFQRGETQYQVCAIIFGGFVKMLGQDDTHPERRIDDERSFTNKTVGQRFLVISSGVVMNLIFASIMFVILFRFTGVVFQRAEVGEVGPGTVAQQAGILPGDRILAVDGKGVRDFGELTLRIALAPPQKDIALRIERPGRNGPFDIMVRPETNKTSGTLHIGISGPGTLIIDDPGDYAGQGGLKRDDEIIALEYDGQRHPCQKFYQFNQIVEARRTKPTNIIAVRDGVELPPIMVRPHMARGSHVMGMRPPTIIESVVDDSLAQKIGLEPGDIIASFDGYAWPDVNAVLKISSSAGKDRRDVPITVLRAGEFVELQAAFSQSRNKKVPLGIAPDEDAQSLYVASNCPKLYENKDNYRPLNLPPEEELAVPVGAQLLAMNGEPLANWSDLIDKLEARAGSKATLTYSLDGKKDQLVFAVPESDSPVWTQHWLYFANLLPKPDQIVVKADSLSGAVFLGMQKTWFWLQGVYLTLTRVAQGSVETEALAGPVGILTFGVQVAREGGAARFFYFMAIIGVNLAIVNFLPIPILDGGHGLFLLIEKIKGSPVSVRVHTIAYTVSMVVLCACFLFITYNDILRMFGLN